jgi:hypothetical protein
MPNENWTADELKWALEYLSRLTTSPITVRRIKRGLERLAVSSKEDQ